MCPGLPYQSALAVAFLVSFQCVFCFSSLLPLSPPLFPCYVMLCYVMSCLQPFSLSLIFLFHRFTDHCQLFFPHRAVRLVLQLRIHPRNHPRLLRQEQKGAVLFPLLSSSLLSSSLSSSLFHSFIFSSCFFLFFPPFFYSFSLLFLFLHLSFLFSSLLFSPLLPGDGGRLRQLQPHRRSGDRRLPTSSRLGHLSRGARPAQVPLQRRAGDVVLPGNYGGHRPRGGIHVSAGSGRRGIVRRIVRGGEYEG